MIKDSGERTEYETGAVRDLKEGKGRFDLMPLEILARWNKEDLVINGLMTIQNCIERESKAELLQAIDQLVRHMIKDSFYEDIIQLSIHFEEGAKKYGEYNWQKGIPIRSYFDSACRHYFKVQAGYDDEPHFRAFLWNLMCMEWTILNNK